MARVASFLSARWIHALASASLLALVLFACNAAPLAPRAGLFESLALSRVAVPGGHVNSAGGNYFHERVDLALDTRLGPFALGAVYNSGWGWTWSVDASYRGGVLRDASGAGLALAALAPSAAVPGTHWVKLDDTRVRTKGGLVYAFDAGTGRLIAIHWANADYPQLRFAQAQIAGQWRTRAVDQCTSASACTRVFALTYDAAARLVRVDDRAGRSALYGYDAAGRLASARDGLDAARGWPGERYEYAGAFLAAIVSSEGERAEITSDASGRALEVRGVGAGDPAWRFAYGFPSLANTYATTATDPLGAVTTWTFDASACLLSVVDPVGDATTYTWSGVRPTSRTDPDGALTRWTWVDDDLASETTPAGNVRTFSYQAVAQDADDPLARPRLETRDAIGLVERRHYDANGWLELRENAEHEGQSFFHAPDGTTLLFTDVDGTTLRFDGYGEHGHPTLVGVGVSPNTWTDVAYDAVGNPLTLPRPAPTSGGAVDYAYDEDRNLAAIDVVDQPFAPAAPHIERIVFSHRSDGQLERVTRPYGGETLFIYDALGRAIERRERVSSGPTPESRSVSARFTYDLAGRLTASELANGMRSELVYDAAGRLARRLASHAGNVESDVRFGYRAGHLTVAQSPDGSFDELLSWDAAGRLVAVRHTLGEITQLAWDARGRAVGSTFLLPSGAPLAALETSYDGADRPLVLSSRGVPLVAQHYASGSLDSVSYGNGLERSVTRSQRLGFETANELLRGTTSLARSDADVAAGEIAGVLRAVRVSIAHSGALNATWSESFDYASGLPLMRADRRLAKSKSPLAGEETFATDALSNLTTVSTFESTPAGVLPVVRAFGFNAEHDRLLTTALVGVGPPRIWQHASDDAGFELARTLVAGGAPARVTFAWSALGQIQEIATDGVADVEASYDALGRRRSLLANGVLRRWRFGGVVEADAQDAPVAIDLGVVRFALNGDHRYRHPDARGNVGLVSNAAGDLVSVRRYAAYGESRLTGAPGPDPGFARGTHVTTGTDELVLLGARVLDPAAGRFLGPDPRWDPINEASYAFGNPIDFWDPAGLHPGHAGGLAEHREIELARIARDNAAQLAVVAVAAAVATRSPAAIAAAIAAAANLIAKQRELDMLERFHEMEFPLQIDPSLALPPSLDPGGFFEAPTNVSSPAARPIITICDTPDVC